MKEYEVKEYEVGGLIAFRISASAPRIFADINIYGRGIEIEKDGSIEIFDGRSENISVSHESPFIVTVEAEGEDEAKEIALAQLYEGYDLSLYTTEGVREFGELFDSDMFNAEVVVEFVDIDWVEELL